MKFRLRDMVVLAGFVAALVCSCAGSVDESGKTSAITTPPVAATQVSFPAPTPAIPPVPSPAAASQTGAASAKPAQPDNASAFYGGVFHFADGPPNGQEMVLKKLQEGAPGLERLPAQRRITAAQLNSASLRVSPPLQAYGLSMNNGERSLGAAHRSNGYYYYFVEESGKVLVYMSVNTSSPDGPIAEGFTFKPPETSEDEALTELAAMERVKGQSYEPRLLSIALGLHQPTFYPAIWLKSTNGNTDLVYFYGLYAPHGLALKTLYTAEEFDKLLAQSN